MLVEGGGGTKFQLTDHQGISIVYGANQLVALQSSAKETDVQGAGKFE
jgi:hypothetical protein